jgi:hypothetical protein
MCSIIVTGRGRARSSQLRRKRSAGFIGCGGWLVSIRLDLILLGRDMSPTHYFLSCVAARR